MYALSECTQSDDNYHGLLLQTCGINNEAEYPVEVVCVRGEACTSGGGELISDDGTCKYDYGNITVFTELDQVRSPEYVGNLFKTGSLSDFVTASNYSLQDFEVEVYNTRNKTNIRKFLKNRFMFDSQQDSAFLFFGIRLREVQQRGHSNVYFVNNMRNRMAIYRAITDMHKYNKLVIFNDLGDVNVTNLLEALDTKYPITDEEDSVAKCGNAAVEPPYHSLVNAFLTRIDYWFSHFWQFVKPVSLDITASKIVEFEQLQVFKDILERHFNFFQRVEQADLKDWHNLVCNAYVKSIEPEITERKNQATRSGLSPTEQEYEREITKYAGYWRVDPFTEGLRASLLKTRGGFSGPERNLVLLGEKNNEHRYNSAEFWRRLLIAIVVRIWQYPHSFKSILHSILIVIFSVGVLMGFTWCYCTFKRCIFPEQVEARVYNFRPNRRT